MIVLVVVVAWIVVMMLIAGLCAAARTGDAQLVLAGDADGLPRVGARAWEPPDGAHIVARESGRSAWVEEREAPLVRGDGVAA